MGSAMLISHYWDDRLMLEDNQKPHILAIGDSWFGYPLNNRLLFVFTQRLKARCGRLSQIAFVDSARLGEAGRPEDIQGKGTMTSSEWADELHPKPRGFNKIVRSCWAPAFAAAGLG